MDAQLCLKGLRLFDKKPMPNWGADLTGVNFDEIKYYVRPTDRQVQSYGRRPKKSKTYDRPVYLKLKNKDWSLVLPLIMSLKLLSAKSEDLENKVLYS